MSSHVDYEPDPHMMPRKSALKDLPRTGPLSKNFIEAWMDRRTAEDADILRDVLLICGMQSMLIHWWLSGFEPLVQEYITANSIPCTVDNQILVQAAVWYYREEWKKCQLQGGASVFKTVIKPGKPILQLLDEAYEREEASWRVKPHRSYRASPA